MWLIRPEVTNEGYQSSLPMNSKREEVVLDSLVFLANFFGNEKSHSL